VREDGHVRPSLYVDVAKHGLAVSSEAVESHEAASTVGRILAALFCMHSMTSWIGYWL